MTYEEAIHSLSALGPELRTTATGEPRKFSLDHIRVLLHALGDPQTRFRSVIIAGTNGKGSTAATLASITAAAGTRTGLYTSPHLLRVNERMRVDAGEISDARFAEVCSRVDDAAKGLVATAALPHLPSFFELLTAIAFCWFGDEGVDLAVLEVGLGGRLDATNAVEPLVSVITDIGIDHTEYLGHTLTEIAREKAGILRQDGVLVTLSQHPEANAAIGEMAMALNVRGVDAARCLAPRQGAGNREQGAEGPLLAANRYLLAVDGDVLQVDSPLAGQHQQRNIALAVATALELRANHGFAISNAAVEEGIRSTVWAGRLEWFPATATRAAVLLDVAHNPAGAWTLRAALAQLPEALPRTLVFSCLADKPVTELAQILLPLFDSSSADPERKHDHVVLAPIQNPRAARMEDLLGAARTLDVPAHAAPHVAAAVLQAEAVTPREGVIVVTGSVFLVGEVRSLLLEQAIA